ncbi:VOC family protein [Leucobacter sp. M11]|uniref:VOC family protein n=1 Tax=Leucobacter sp. M11 TaxID=2993565 RepID=UPI002D7FD766|nr:lactoylglutathione lyase [Leucobacter sp. M11]MEB4614632.1 lactoylglutathione lyase [Leucobacter sp. M11]
MSQKLFVNLPVRSLSESERFYVGLGLKKNERFSSRDATALQLTDSISVMLLATPFFEGFLVEGDTAHLRSHGKEVLNALELKSRAEVERWCVLAVSYGGTVYRPGVEQHGMFSAAIADPDGHVWELLPPMEG